MKRVIGEYLTSDYLTLNRSTPVRVFESNGVLYLDHATDSGAPVIEYSENTLLDFAGAYYPKNLLEFAEKHGTLFNIDKYAMGSLSVGKYKDIWPEPQGDLLAPSEDALRELFGELNYPDGKKRKITQDFKRIHRDSLDRVAGYCWLANQREYLGDWVAARSMFQKALDLLGGASAVGRKGACPDFSVNLANAPRYRRFLSENMGGFSWEMIAHNVNGSTKSEIQGFFFDGDTFRCHMPNNTVEEVISKLVTMHLKQGVRLNCEKLELRESFHNLIEVIWYQIPEQIDSRLVIGHCENPRCGNVMLKLRNVEKHACCDSCQQALKEGR